MCEDEEMSIVEISSEPSSYPFMGILLTRLPVSKLIGIRVIAVTLFNRSTLRMLLYIPFNPLHHFSTSKLDYEPKIIHLLKVALDDDDGLDTGTLRICFVQGSFPSFF